MESERDAPYGNDRGQVVASGRENVVTSPGPIDGIAASLALKRPPGPADLGDAYSDMIRAFRMFADGVAGAAPAAPVVRRLERDLRSWIDVLRELQVPDRERLWGRWLERPGRAQGLVPAIADEVLTATAAAGTVVFGNFYAGKNGAAHGGSVPLLFDEVFGRMGFASNTAGRTAFLRTDYRSVTPTGAELTLVCRLDRVEGRKRYFSGELRNGEVVCVEAESLWVELKPGQP